MSEDYPRSLPSWAASETTYWIAPDLRGRNSRSSRLVSGSSGAASTARPTS